MLTSSCSSHKIMISKLSLCLAKLNNIFLSFSQSLPVGHAKRFPHRFPIRRHIIYVSRNIPSINQESPKKSGCSVDRPKQYSIFDKAKFRSA